MPREIHKISLVCFLTFSMLVPVQGQAPTITSAPPQQKANQPSADDDVVRITTNLVQVDVVVKDKDGKIVTDLTAEDFEVLEEGRPQQITNSSFISTAPPSSSDVPVATVASNAASANNKNVPPVPPVNLRPEQVRRTFAIVVGGKGMSLGSFNRIRAALRQFVDEQMQPGDLVGIFHTNRRSGSLHGFTADKNQLHGAIKSLRFRPSPFSSGDIFDPVRADYTVKVPVGRPGEESGLRPGGPGARTFEDQNAREARQRLEASDRDLSGNETVLELSFFVRSMEELPGRKSVVFFSDGLPVWSGALTGGSTLRALRRLVDIANRASVVLHAIDARGVVDPGFISAADEILPEDTVGLRAARHQGFFESQNGLNLMAADTGGIFTHSANDLNVGLRRILENERGYYLLGYRPDAETFKEGKFRNISVRVKRPGLRVQTRKGFYGVTDEALRRKTSFTGDKQLYAALASPLNAEGVRARLTPLFGSESRVGPFVRLLLHIDARDLKFVDEANGWKKVVLDVAAVTFGEGADVADQFNRTHTIRLGPDTLPFVEQYGLIYTADVPVKKPGGYQFRAVVRDASSQKIGSVGQFIEVPDLKQKRLALSGIALAEADPNGAFSLPPSAPVEAAFSPIRSATGPALRRFRPGMALSYSHLIYNARLDPKTRRPQLTTQLLLFREGQQVFASPEIPFDAGTQTDFTNLNNDGLFRLSPTAAPGDYVLQVIVKDQLAGEKSRPATQWLDFEVVK